MEMYCLSITRRIVMVAKGRVKNGLVVLGEGVQLPEGQEVTILTPDCAATPEGRGWPKGYFENTFGSITDETFIIRPPQGDLPKPLELE
jgi:hypothetical protein